LITDASGIAVAGILLQTDKGKQKIIGCISKTLSETEQCWSATEREAYAILYSVEKFSYFLKGPKAFILLTDHKSLTFMDKNIFSNAKIARWQDRLSSYNFICQYIEGIQNNFADMFSRPFLPITKSKIEQPEKILGQFYSVPNSLIKIYIPS
jgi:hypothetical protein